MLHMPSPMLLRPSAARTYAEFQDHIRTLTSNTRGWTESVILQKAVATAENTLTNSGLVGSSWGANPRFRQNSSTTTLNRVMQHAFASQAIFNTQSSEGRDFYYETINGGAVTSLPSVNRNGFTSSSYSGGGVSSIMMSDLIRWDSALGIALRSNPSIGSAEAEYIW